MGHCSWNAQEVFAESAETGARLSIAAQASHQTNKANRLIRDANDVEYLVLSNPERKPKYRYSIGQISGTNSLVQ